MESSTDHNQSNPLSKKALKKLRRKDQSHHSVSEIPLKKLYDNDGIWSTIIEYLSMQETMMIIAVLSRRDWYLVDSYWCQYLFLSRGLEEFSTLNIKDVNSTLCSFDQKGYFSKLKSYQKIAKRQKQPMGDTEETHLERKKIFKRLYQKLKETHTNNVLLVHNTMQAIRSEIQRQFLDMRNIWSSLNSGQFECFHQEFTIEENDLTDKEKDLLRYDLGNYYRFNCKKCGIMAISNFKPIFTGIKRRRNHTEVFRLVNICKNH